MGNIRFSVGSGVNESIFGASQAPIRTMIERKAQAWEDMSALKHIYNFGPSRHFAEKVTSMTGTAGFQPVGEGGAYPVDNMQEGFSKTIQHETWKDSMHITREAVDDAKIIDLKKRPASFVNGYYSARERFGAVMLAGSLGKTVQFRGRTFDTSGADGLPLFSKEHPSALKEKKSLKQSNLFAGAFSKAVLGQVETRMQNFVDDRGEPLTVAPDTIIIENDAGLKNTVFEVIGADKDPSTSNNGFNYQYGRWNVIVWPYLNGLFKDYISTGDKPFILLDSRYNETYEGADWLERVKLEVRSEISANDDNVWKGYARFGVGFNDWRCFAIGGVTNGTAL